MVFSGVMCTEAEIDQRSGANVSVSFNDVMKTASCATAEATVNLVMRYDATTNWVSMTDYAKETLTAIVASMVALDAINYDMSGFTTRHEAEAMLTILNNTITRGLSIIKNMDKKDFIKA